MSSGNNSQPYSWAQGPSETPGNTAQAYSAEDDPRPQSGSARDPQQALSEQEQQRLHMQHQTDVAGVLRRNQACLACRRRKLKCDAIRPHCSTCVRSHKHMMRTSPLTNPTLSCDYDDGQGGNDVVGHLGNSPVDDDGESARKKRKSTGGESNKRKKNDHEAEKLKKRIEELEARLAGAAASSASRHTAQSQSSTSSTSHPARPSISTRPISRVEETTAQSPTSFLDILSAAATVHAPGTTSRSSSGGLRAGVTGAAMMNGATGTFVPSVAPAESPNFHTGFTPAFTFTDYQQSSNEMRPPPPVHHQSTGSSTSGASVPAPNTPFNHSLGSGSSDPVPLTPSGIFNFSPGPPEPVDYESMPLPDKSGMIYPSARLSGPWKGIETIDTFVASAQAKASQFTNINDDVPMPIDPATDPTCLPGSTFVQLNQDTTFVQMGSSAAKDVPLATYPPLAEEDLQQQYLMDLFWPGWPSGLPEPHIVNELTDVFFDMVPSLPRMLLRSRFMTRMTLPPTHSNFPHPALLHSICAIASNWCAPSVYEKSTVARTLNGLGAKNVEFSTWQSGLAKEAVHDGLNTGDRMLDVVRSMMILSRLFIDDTRMLECWAFHGLVARMILPLGLNVRSAELSLKSVMLPPPADAIEREERRGAMWFAFYHDTISSAASGWGSSISLDELTCPLPCSFKDFDSGSKDIPSNPQDAESSDLYTHHPVVDPLVMCLKACIILHRVTRFARKWKNRHVRDDDDYAGMQKPDFRELANNIACLQMSFPYEIRNPCKMDDKRRLDIDLIVAHMLPHAALIILYEPFADVSDSADASARRILSAAQAIVGIVQQLAAAINEGSSNFANVMHSAASVCLVTAGRTCLLFYRHALNVKDNVLAASLRSDVEMLRMALEQFGLRFKIGHHHAQLIAYFLDRATHPTFEKLIAHYPDHPRPGAPVLHPGADFGVCVLNALNVKRGYWRIRRDQRESASAPASAGISPFGSTPDSGTGQGYGGSGSGGPCNVYGAARIETESPQQPFSGMQSASGSANHTTTLADIAGGSSNIVADEDEAGVGAWLPHIGVNPSRAASGDSRPKADAFVMQGESVMGLEWEKVFAGDTIQQSPDSGAGGSGSADPYAQMNRRMEIQPSGQRNIFGSGGADPTAGVGTRLDPFPYVVLGDAAETGPTKGVAAEYVGKGSKAPLLAETAAWFMQAEPGGFRGPK